MIVIFNGTIIGCMEIVVVFVVIKEIIGSYFSCIDFNCCCIGYCSFDSTVTINFTDCKMDCCNCYFGVNCTEASSRYSLITRVTAAALTYLCTFCLRRRMMEARS